jgi:LysM repeat protein
LKAKGTKAAVLAPAFFVGISSLLACGPLFAKNMLDRGDESVLVAPTIDFYQELKRIPMSLTPVHAVTSTNSYSEETTEAELADLRAALRAATKSSNEVDRIVLGHAEQRMKLQQFGEKFGEWKESSSMMWDADDDRREKPVGAQPGYPSLSLVDGLPGEFADYFQGAIIWDNADMKDKSATRASWERLLNQPPEERHYKSTWAAYMLGRSWEDEDPKKAREYYQQVRALVSQGFADTTGLAEASLGWEARLALRAGEFETALDLYLQQYAAGGSSAANSLKFAVGQVIEAGPKAYVPLAINPQQRKLITAYLLWLYPDAENPETVHAWLEAVEQAGVKDAESAEQFAVAAYQADDMESTIRWVTRAGNTPTAQWILAKLLLRVGNTDKATTILSRIMDSFPMEKPTNSPTSFSDGLFVQANPRIYAGRYIRGELGTLRLARREFTQALDLFLHGYFWEDAAYVADRVLTTDELKSYVDANWTEIAPSQDGEMSVREKEYGTLTSQIRYLLARRLARESRIAEARVYFPTNWVPLADRLMQALTIGWDEALPAEQRANELRAAAFIAQTNGMELMGTETAPDWFTYGGGVEGNWPMAKRTNGEAVLIAASANEIKRNEESRPEPDKRYHYRYQAAELAWEAAKLMPNNSDETARLLCTAGSWLKYLEPDAADRFYKALVRRCRKTEIGAKADKLRWFPELDAEGNLRRSRFELMKLPGAQEIGTGGGIAVYPTPGKHFIISDVDRMSDIVAAVQRLGFTLTAKDIYAANPELSRWNNNVGREILIPRTQEKAVPIEPSLEEPTLIMNEPAPAPGELPDDDQGMSYIVLRGDTIVTVAKQYSVTLNTLLEANPGLDPSRLKIGQKIRIPANQ